MRPPRAARPPPAVLLLLLLLLLLAPGGGRAASGDPRRLLFPDQGPTVPLPPALPPPPPPPPFPAASPWDYPAAVRPPAPVAVPLRQRALRAVRRRAAAWGEAGRRARMRATEWAVRRVGAGLAAYQRRMETRVAQRMMLAEGAGAKAADLKGQLQEKAEDFHARLDANLRRVPGYKAAEKAIDAWQGAVAEVCPTGLISLSQREIPPFVILLGERQTPSPPPPPPLGTLYCGYTYEDFRELATAGSQILSGLVSIVQSQITLEVAAVEAGYIKGPDLEPLPTPAIDPTTGRPFRT